MVTPEHNDGVEDDEPDDAERAEQSPEGDLHRGLCPSRGATRLGYGARRRPRLERLKLGEGGEEG